LNWQEEQCLCVGVDVMPRKESESDREMSGRQTGVMSLPPTEKDTFPNLTGLVKLFSRAIFNLQRR
jgi:hypothetical protein